MTRCEQHPTLETPCTICAGQKLLNQSYVVKMPDGSRWAVPVRVIAENKARSYSESRFGGDFDSALEAVILLFDDDGEIADWAKNNMNWKEVWDKAVMIEGSDPPDYDEGWNNGEWSVETL